MNQMFQLIHNSLAQPHWLWLLLVLIPMIGLRIWSHSTSHRKLVGLVSPRLFDRLVQNTNQSRQWLSFIFLVMSIVCLIVALARPRWGTETLPSYSEGRSLMIAIDTSRSMLADDVLPNRLERTKLAVRDIIEQLDEDRIGLIAFAGKAFIQAPLTNDREAIIESIEQLDTNIIPRGGTNLVSPIRLTLQALQEENSKQSALVIFSDGEALEGQVELNRLKQLAKQKNLAIITIGVGTVEGSLIRLENGEFVTDESDNKVVTRMDSKALRTLTNDTGFYLQLGDQRSMNRVVKAIRANLQVTRREQQEEVRELEQFMWPLSLAILFMVISHLVHLLFQFSWKQSTVSSKSKKSALAILIAFLGVVHQADGLDRSAWDYLEREDYSQAEEKLLSSLENARLSEREKAHTFLGLGIAYYRTGDFERSTKAFGKALICSDKRTRENAHYNLGNSLVRRGELILNPNLNQPEASQPMTNDPDRVTGAIVQWLGAIEHYEAVGRLNSKNINARHNIEILKQRIRELKNEPPPENNDNQNNDQQQPPQNQDGDQNSEQQESGDSSNSGSDSTDENKDGSNSDSNKEGSNSEQGDSDQSSPDQPEGENEAEGEGEGSEQEADTPTGDASESELIKKQAAIKNSTTGYSPSEARQIIGDLSGDKGLRPVFPKGTKRERYKNW